MCGYVSASFRSIDFFVRSGIQKTFYKVRNSTGAVSLENRLAAFCVKSSRNTIFLRETDFFYFVIIKL